jgi:CheY-like chemotaxis protein
MIRVLLADDDQLTRTGLRLIIESDPGLRVVGEAADGQEAIHLARALRPEVVLMDIRMPGVDGLEATRRIVQAAQDGPRVLILTTFELDEYVFGALRAGASGFLLKRSSPEVLIEGIKVVAAVAAYSPRIRPGAPVSFPVAWDQLDRVTPADFTLRTAARSIVWQSPWADAMPPPQHLGADLIEEGRAIPVARVQAMHEGKRRARARRG